jgi:hypothetical protein
VELRVRPVSRRQPGPRTMILVLAASAVSANYTHWPAASCPRPGRLRVLPALGAEPPPLVQARDSGR